MKKNKMMRLASGLLVAVLLTTCAISGTFAKYVTQASGQNSARVAKWGVEVTAMGEDLFSTAYAAEGTHDFTNSVEAKDTTNVVAPGTKNTDGVSFSVTGTPEVAVKIDIAVTGAGNAEKATDVVLPAKEGYTDWTQAPYNGTFNVAADYHPVVFTLKDGTNVLKTGTLADIETYLKTELSKEYEPNTDLSKITGADGTGNYTLTWEWPFPETYDAETDKKDTLLGNIATGDAKYAVEGASTKIDFGIAITVTQID